MTKCCHGRHPSEQKRLAGDPGWGTRLFVVERFERCAGCEGYGRSFGCVARKCASYFAQDDKLWG